MIISTLLFVSGAISGAFIWMVLSELTQSPLQRYLNKWINQTDYGAVIKKDVKVYKVFRKGLKPKHIKNKLGIKHHDYNNSIARLRKYGMIKYE